jgi:hypothetical protein
MKLSELLDNMDAFTAQVKAEDAEKARKMAYVFMAEVSEMTKSLELDLTRDEILKRAFPSWPGTKKTA